MLSKNEKLSNKTTTGIGGVVDYFLEPKTFFELGQSLYFCFQNQLSFYFLAGGSNTIFSDSIYPSQAIISLTNLNELEFENGIIVSECGVKLQKVVDFALNLGFEGVAGLNRIPGTIGGAVLGNAGAYGSEIKDLVDYVQYLDVDKLFEFSKDMNFETFEQNMDSFLITINNQQCQFDYRDSIFKQKQKMSKNWLIYKVGLKPNLASDLILEKQKYDQISEKRDAIYPLGLKSPGSVFKNIFFDTLDDDVKAKIPADWVMFGNKLPVGKLLEEVGAKGLCVGEVGMRDSHANILINYGKGDYQSVVELVQDLKAKVKARFGIEIEPEIRLVGGDFSERL
jgi:UDP-N-acetylmuramate dehydrogenase